MNRSVAVALAVARKDLASEWRTRDSIGSEGDLLIKLRRMAAEPDGSAFVDDVLDDIATQVLRTEGTIVAVPADQMPTDTGVAAVFRY